jgi:hypothetical protein
LCTENDPIIRGSIRDWQKTDLSVLYNDFNIQYNRNPGLNKLDRSLVVTHVDDDVTTTDHDPGDGFPDITYLDVDGIPLWEKYCNFPGIPKTPVAFDPTTALPANPEIGDSYLSTATANGWVIDHYYERIGGATPSWFDGGTAASSIDCGYPYAYSKAKALWEPCNTAYKQNFVIQQPGEDLAKLEWYPDRSILSDLTKAAQGINDHSSAFMFLIKLVGWDAVQKDMVSYSVPINSDTVTLDLLQPIKFSDLKYTNSVQRVGWIVNISPNSTQDIFDITLILKPI